MQYSNIYFPEAYCHYLIANGYKVSVTDNGTVLKFEHGNIVAIVKNECIDVFQKQQATASDTNPIEFVQAFVGLGCIQTLPDFMALVHGMGIVKLDEFMKLLPTELGMDLKSILK